MLVKFEIDWTQGSGEKSIFLGIGVFVCFDLFLFFAPRASNMVKQISKQVSRRIIELASQGHSPRQIATTLGIAPSTALKVTKKHSTKLPDPKLGRPLILDQMDERYISRLAVTGKCSTAKKISKELEINAGITASPKTILRCLKRNGINSRYKIKKPQLSKSHRRARREFEKSHRTWTDDDWDKVLWSDETKICLQGSDGRERTLVRDGEALREHNIMPTKKYGGGSIMVWGCMFSCAGSMVVSMLICTRIFSRVKCLILLLGMDLIPLILCSNKIMLHVTKQKLSQNGFKKKILKP